MPTLIAGSAANFTVQVQQDGSALAVSGALSARIFSMDGKTELVATTAVSDSSTGADWASGVVAVSFTADQTSALSPGDAMLVLSGDVGIKRFRVIVETLFAATRTSLFIKDIVVNEIRTDRLMAAAAGVLQDVKVSDDYLWEKVRTAEAEITHTLRVPLVPTRYFPLPPSDAQIEALDGMAWEIDPPYDYDPSMFKGDRWGYFITRKRPIISVERLRFNYPASNDGYMDIPADWIKADNRYGHLRLVPNSPAIFATMSVYVLGGMFASQSIPNMIELEYTAGLTDVSTKYPELLDVIKKLAVLKIVGDAYLPQSGSISADGLSESLSVDMSAYHDSIDEILNGPKGSNGGLMTQIHGIRVL
jgi:hypothetical protein